MLESFFSLETESSLHLAGCSFFICDIWISVFLLSGVLSFVWIFFCEISSESVDMTVKELQQNLLEIMSKASESDRKKLGFAKVVGIACDVCKPEDVEKLSSFAVEELGSINIWVKKKHYFISLKHFSLRSYFSLLTLFFGQINNAGTNKGFRPLLDFTEEDIKQVKESFIKVLAYGLNNGGVKFLGIIFEMFADCVHKLDWIDSMHTRGVGSDE